MARRYTRDNRGRFASVGATARGGRLKTASGARRETQTMRSTPRSASGTIRPRSKGTQLQARSATATRIGAPIGGTRSTATARRIADTTKPPVQTSRLVAQGGRVWQKGQYNRVYFNDIAARVGVQTTRYNTGNISSATLKGNSISNSSAAKIIRRSGEAKMFYDRNTKRMMIQRPAMMDTEGRYVAGALPRVARSTARAARMPVKRARKRRQR